jgi:hypothetical protein
MTGSNKTPAQPTQRLRDTACRQLGLQHRVRLPKRTHCRGMVHSRTASVNEGARKPASLITEGDVRETGADYVRPLELSLSGTLDD